MKKWFKYVRPYLPYFILGPICMIVEVVGSVWMPKLLAVIIDYGLGNKDPETAGALVRWIYRAAGGASPFIIAVTVGMILTALIMMVGGVGGAYLPPICARTCTARCSSFRFPTLTGSAPGRW